MHIQESLAGQSATTTLLNQADGTVSIQSNGAANAGVFATTDGQVMQHGDPSSSHLEYPQEPDHEDISGTAVISHSQYDPGF